MTEIMSKCGYRCDLCPAYKGNVRSEAEQKQVSEGFARYFGFSIPPAEIACRGCSPDCLDKDCPVRPCIEAKGLAHCALCDEFPCPKIESRMDFIPNYLAEHKELVVPREDYRRFFRPYESRERLFGLVKGKGEKKETGVSNN